MKPNKWQDPQWAAQEQARLMKAKEDYGKWPMSAVGEAEASVALDRDPSCETIALARERKTYDEPQVDAEVLEQGLMVKTEGGQGADEVPTALEAAQRRIGEERAEPQPELAPRLRVGAQVANLWGTGCQRFAPVAGKRRVR